MPPPLTNTEKTIQRVAEATSGKIADWREGVSIETRFGQPIQDIMKTGISDRVRLARRFHREGKQAQSSGRNREAISRYYYCMYHLFRSVVFFSTNGDDHQKHADVSQHIPNDFPDSNSWKNDLKAARLLRNSADYDLYPLLDSKWKNDVDQVADQATKALVTAKTYFLSKGFEE
jgi:uncharacterized protein (UPF0332 family)